MKIQLTYATHIGGRERQEDRFVATEHYGGVLMAVMDGHGGSAETAEIVQENFERVFDNVHHRMAGRSALTTVFAELHELTKERFAGTTLSVAWIPGGATEVFVAVLGDSPVVVRSKGVLWVGPEHNARTNPEEREAAIDRGAIEVGTYLTHPMAYPHDRSIHPTRALGDRIFPFQRRDPEAFSLPIGEGSVVLVASDGLFDAVHHTSPVACADEILSLVDAGADADALVRMAVEECVSDNVTAILCRVT